MKQWAPALSSDLNVWRYNAWLMMAGADMGPGSVVVFAV